MINSYITILGCNSSLPTRNFYPTSQILYMRENYFLIDCGEGTQVQLIKAKIKINKINNILISHLHGDHYYGIMGILSTYQLLGRKNPLNIYSPNGLKNIIYENFKWSKSNITYPLNFIILKTRKYQKIYENDNVKIYIIPLKHKIYTNGFLFKEKKRLRNLNIKNVNKIKEIKISDYLNIKKGKDFIKKNGQIIPNNYLTFKPNKPLSYAFCTDTSYSPKITKYLKNVDLLYHESTFLHEKKIIANKRGHSTTIQAAKIAKLSNVKKLLLGHYSCRYPNIKDFEKEAQKIFPNTEASKNLKTYLI
ncbi:ribonuclease Z [Candidatus Shikimatogenerans bostrichidophilus]|uniref:ribonuclease Z n=1 Tax=Candidatus Shikimatogenerans bostrichidophilus TaxID=2943807 RepID=UPI0029669AC8